MEKRPFVVAIAGGTCSGKSTLTDRLEANFATLCPTAVLHMDSYYKKECPTVVAPITGKVYPEHNTPDSLEMERFYSDFAQAVAPGSGNRLVLVEGLFPLHLEAIRERADLKVFVDLKATPAWPADREVHGLGGHLPAGHRPVPGHRALPPQRAGGAQPLARGPGSQRHPGRQQGRAGPVRLFGAHVGAGLSTRIFFDKAPEAGV